MRYQSFVSICIILLVSGCAKSHDPRDPYENFNRAMFNFNDGIDRAFIKPIAKGYNKILPSLLRQGITNVYSNVAEIPSVAGNLLQGNWRGLGNSTGRLVYNSTFGLGGLIDVAKHMGLEEKQTDMGVTFAVWGNRHSPFLVLPFLGPTTIRDFSGFIFDFSALSPFSYVKNPTIRWGTTGLWAINRRASILDVEKISDEFTYDPYLLQRDAFLQYRDNRIRMAYGEPAADTYVEGDTSDDALTTGTDTYSDNKATNNKQKNPTTYHATTRNRKP